MPNGTLEFFYRMLVIIAIGAIFGAAVAAIFTGTGSD
jgi:hypothetical protein